VSQGAATTVDVTVVEDTTVTVEVEFRNELDPTPTPPVETPTPPVETPTPPVETPTPPVETPTPPPPGTLIIHKVITNLGEEGTDDASEDDEFVATVNGTGATFSMANPATVDGLDAGGYTVTEHLNDEDDYFVVGWALAVDGICPAEPTSAEGAASANVTVVSGAATEVCFYNMFIVEEELPDVTTPTPTPAPEETPAPPDAGSGMTQGPAGSQVMLVAMALLSISTGAMLLTLGRRRMTAA
jgi:hypothetical protein